MFDFCFLWFFLRSGKTTGQYSTQISKFFPKASTSTQPIASEPLIHHRKRKALPSETIPTDPLRKSVEVTPTKIPKKSKEPPTITKFFQSHDSSDDFETPRKKPPPVARAVPPKKALTTKKTKTRPKKDARKDSIVSKFFSNNGIDAEHLQMALALARSVEQTSGPCENVDAASMSTQEKRETVKNMFQKFGFKAPTSRGEFRGPVKWSVRQFSDQYFQKELELKFSCNDANIYRSVLFRRLQSECMAWIV